MPRHHFAVKELLRISPADSIHPGRGDGGRTGPSRDVGRGIRPRQTMDEAKEPISGGNPVRRERLPLPKAVQGSSWPAPRLAEPAIPLLHNEKLNILSVRSWPPLLTQLFRSARSARNRSPLPRSLGHPVHRRDRLRSPDQPGRAGALPLLCCGGRVVKSIEAFKAKAEQTG